MDHPGSSNLKPCLPGEVRNPKGRPKGSRDRATIVREALEAILEGTDQMVVDAIVAAQVKGALNGGVRAFKELMDSGYGKVKDEINITGPIQTIGTITNVEEAAKAYAEVLNSVKPK